MKTLGLTGGTTWISTAEGDRSVNTKVNQRPGGLYSAKILLHSIEFAEFKSLADRGDWKTVSVMFSAAEYALAP